MTNVQQKTIALWAALALVVGFGLAVLAPQQAQAEVATKLVAGSQFGTATSLVLTSTDLTASNKTEFNSNADNNFYKFKTSSRDSRYKIRLRSYKGYKIYCTLYDESHHRIAYVSTESKKGQTWIFKNLKRNSTYYIELWRFAVDGQGYLASGTVLDMGVAESAYPPYKITLSEIVTKPYIHHFIAYSNTKHHMKLAWTEPSYNTEQVQIEFWWSWQSKKTSKNTFYRYTTKSRYDTYVTYSGPVHPYKVRMRPMMKVNGKNVYGKWVNAYVKKSGKWVKPTTPTTWATAIIRSH